MMSHVLWQTWWRVYIRKKHLNSNVNFTELSCGSYFLLCTPDFDKQTWYDTRRVPDMSRVSTCLSFTTAPVVFILFSCTILSFSEACAMFCCVQRQHEVCLCCSNTESIPQAYGTRLNYQRWETGKMYYLLSVLERKVLHHNLGTFLWWFEYNSSTVRGCIKGQEHMNLVRQVSGCVMQMLMLYVFLVLSCMSAAWPVDNFDLKSIANDILWSKVVSCQNATLE